VQIRLLFHISVSTEVLGRLMQIRLLLDASVSTEDLGLLVQIRLFVPENNLDPAIIFY
jgi:hypothetical protein